MGNVMRILMAAILVTTSAGPAFSATTELADQVHAIIGNKQGLNAPGCAVSLLQQGKPILTIADGAADIATKRPLDADTQFYSASIAKQFTALAIAQLVVDGKIRLDDDIRTYLPDMPDYGHPITVGMLMHHTSGIRDMLELGNYAGYENSAAVSRSDALRLVYAQRGTIFPPGSEHRYSNSGYLLLSEIVAQVSGTSFADYMQRHVFAPLKMTRTAVLTGARTDDANAAHGYAPAATGYRLADTHPFYGGSGGMIFSLNDLASYDRDIQLVHKVWTPAVAKILLAPGTLTSGRPAMRGALTYAGGVTLNGDWTQHGGAGEGFENYVAWLPNGRLSVHVLCNDGAAKASAIAAQLVAALGDYPPLEPAQPAIAGRYVSPDAALTYRLTPHGDTKLTIDIEPADGAPGRRRTVELTKATDGSFTGKGFNLTLDADYQGFTLGGLRSRTGLLHFERSH